MGAIRKWTDDDLLDWVNKRAAGVSPNEIAAEYGANPQYVRAATARVRKHDGWHHDDKIEFPKHKTGVAA